MTTSQITYKHLRPGVEPTGDEELLKAEPLHKRRVHTIDEPPRHSVGDIVQVSDIRHGGAKRPYKVIKVGSIIYHTDTAGDLQAAINNRTYYVTDT